MVKCWHKGCKHYNQRETCKFFRFSISDQRERETWKKLIGRPEEPGPGAYVCSCHFPLGKREHGPRIFDPEVLQKFPGGLGVVTPKKSVGSHILVRNRQVEMESQDVVCVDDDDSEEYFCDEPSSLKIEMVMHLNEDGDNQSTEEDLLPPFQTTPNNALRISIGNQNSEIKKKLHIPSEPVLIAEVTKSPKEKDEKHQVNDNKLGISSEIETCDLTNEPDESSNSGVDDDDLRKGQQTSEDVEINAFDNVVEEIGEDVIFLGEVKGVGEDIVNKGEGFEVGEDVIFIGEVKKFGDDVNNAEVKETAEDFVTHTEVKEMPEDTVTHGEVKEMPEDIVAHGEVKEVREDIFTHCEVKETAEDIVAHGEVKETAEDIVTHAEVKEMPEDIVTHAEVQGTAEDFDNAEVKVKAEDIYNAEVQGTAEEIFNNGEVQDEVIGIVSYEDSNCVWIPETNESEFIPEGIEVVPIPLFVVDDDDSGEREARPVKKDKKSPPEELISCLKKRNSKSEEVKPKKKVRWSEKNIEFTISPRRPKRKIKRSKLIGPRPKKRKVYYDPDEEEDDKGMENEVKVKSEVEGEVQNEVKDEVKQEVKVEVKQEPKEELPSTSQTDQDPSTSGERRNSKRATFGNRYHLAVAPLMKESKPSIGNSPPKSSSTSSDNKKQREDQNLNNPKSKDRNNIGNSLEKAGVTELTRKPDTRYKICRDGEGKFVIEEFGRFDTKSNSKREKAGKRTEREPKKRRPRRPSKQNSQEKESLKVKAKSNGRKESCEVNNNSGEPAREVKFVKSKAEEPKTGPEIEVMTIRIRTPEEIAQSLGLTSNQPDHHLTDFATSPEGLDYTSNAEDEYSEIEEPEEFGEVPKLNMERAKALLTKVPQTLSEDNEAFCREIVSTSKAVIAETQKIIAGLSGYLCWGCGFETVTLNDLKAHVTAEHWNYRPSILCLFCDTAFYSRTSLVEHLDRAHFGRVLPTIAGDDEEDLESDAEEKSLKSSDLKKTTNPKNHLMRARETIPEDPLGLERDFSKCLKGVVKKYFPSPEEDLAINPQESRTKPQSFLRKSHEDLESALSTIIPEDPLRIEKDLPAADDPSSDATIPGGLKRNFSKSFEGFKREFPEGLKSDFPKGLEGFKRAIPKSFEGGLKRDFPEDLKRDFPEGLERDFPEGLKRDSPSSQGGLKRCVPLSQEDLKRKFPTSPEGVMRGFTRSQEGLKRDFPGSPEKSGSESDFPKRYEGLRRYFPLSQEELKRNFPASPEVDKRDFPKSFGGGLKRGFPSSQEGHKRDFPTSQGSGLKRDFPKSPGGDKREFPKSPGGGRKRDFPRSQEGHKRDFPTSPGGDERDFPKTPGGGLKRDFPRSQGGHKRDSPESPEGLERVFLKNPEDGLKTYSARGREGSLKRDPPKSLGGPSRISGKPPTPGDLSPTPSDSPRLLRCPLCDFHSGHYSLLMSHMRERHQNPTEIDYLCMFCPKTFTSVTAFSVHIVTFHSVGSNGHCVYCEHAFSAVEKIRIPTNSPRESNRPYCCQLCSYSTNKGENFMSHCVQKHVLRSQLMCSKYNFYNKQISSAFKSYSRKNCEN